MRYQFLFVSLLLLTWLPVAGQQNAQIVHPTGAEVTAPILLPSNLTVSTPKHCDELDGVVKFAATIDAAGLPHGLKTLEASDFRLVGFATELIEAQRFKPGTIDGAAATVAVELTIGLHTCAQREKHPTGENFYRFTLRAHPLIALAVIAPPAGQTATPTPAAVTATTEKVGAHISAPIPTVVIDPEIPVSKKLPKHGQCLVGITIDANGVPQNVRVVRSLDPELDSYAVEAAKNWRFKPALRDGKVPVAVEGTVAAAFLYIENEPIAFAGFIPKMPEDMETAIARHDKESINLEPMNADEVFARYYKRHNRISGLCLVVTVIDPDGVPQNVHVIKSVDSGQDTDAVEMVEQLRFKPVKMDGTTPVSVGLVIPLNYRANTWKNYFVAGLHLAILIFA